MGQKKSKEHMENDSGTDVSCVCQFSILQHNSQGEVI